MQTLNNNFFPTSSPQDPLGNTFSLLNKLNGANRIKQLKKQMKLLSTEKVRAQSQLLRTKKSINQLSRQTQLTKINFTKLYESKKLKLTNKQIIQNKEISDKQRNKQIKAKTKENHLLDVLQLQATKQEEASKNQLRKELNKKEKQKIRKELKLNNLEREAQSRTNFRRTKEHRNQIMNRNRKIEEILYMKGKYNYAEKTQKQLSQIKEYQLMLSELQEIEKRDCQFRPMTAFSKSFLITNLPQEILKTQEKPVSTRHTYRARSKHI